MRKYTAEIAYVAFLHGWVVWIDDEPWHEGEPFASKRQAVREINHHFARTTEPSRLVWL